MRPAPRRFSCPGPLSFNFIWCHTKQDILSVVFFPEHFYDFLSKGLKLTGLNREV